MRNEINFHEVETCGACAPSERQWIAARWVGLAVITSVSTATWMLVLVAGSYGLGMALDVRFTIGFGLAIALISFIGAAIVAVNRSQGVGDRTAGCINCRDRSHSSRALRPVVRDSGLPAR